MGIGGDLTSKRSAEKDAGRAGQQGTSTDQGRPKRARRPSLKILEGAVLDGPGSSVEAMIPPNVSSFVSSGSSLLTLAAGEENDTARVVPEMGMYTGLYLSNTNGNTATYTKQRSGACPSKQGSNEQEEGVGVGKQRLARSQHGVPSSLIGSMTDVKFPMSASDLGEGGRSGKSSAQQGHNGVAGVCQGIGKLQEYYGSHQAYYMESMTHLIGAMSHKAQQMVLQGESLNSMRMKEALDAVATANAIIWRASATLAGTLGGRGVGGCATAMVGNETDADPVDPVDPPDPVSMYGAAAMRTVSPPTAVVVAGDETYAVGKDGGGEPGQVLDTLA